MTALDMQTVIDLSLMRAGNADAARRVMSMHGQRMHDDIADNLEIYAAAVEYAARAADPDTASSYRRAWEQVRIFHAAPHDEQAQDEANRQLEALLSPLPRGGYDFVGVLSETFEARGDAGLTLADWEKLADLLADDPDYGEATE